MTLLELDCMSSQVVSNFFFLRLAAAFGVSRREQVSRDCWCGVWLFCKEFSFYGWCSTVCTACSQNLIFHVVSHFPVPFPVAIPSHLAHRLKCFLCLMCPCLQDEYALRSHSFAQKAFKVGCFHCGCSLGVCACARVCVVDIPISIILTIGRFSPSWRTGRQAWGHYSDFRSRYAFHTHSSLLHCLLHCCRPNRLLCSMYRTPAKSCVRRSCGLKPSYSGVVCEGPGTLPRALAYSWDGEKSVSLLVLLVCYSKERASLWLLTMVFTRW